MGGYCIDYVGWSHRFLKLHKPFPSLRLDSSKSKMSHLLVMDKIILFTHTQFFNTLFSIV